MKIISNLVIYYMSKIEISNYTEPISYIVKKEGPDIIIGKNDNLGNFMRKYGSINLKKNNIYEFYLSDPNLSSGDYIKLQNNNSTDYDTGDLTGTVGSPGAKLTFTIPSNAPSVLSFVGSYGELNLRVDIGENTNIDNKSFFSKTYYKITYDETSSKFIINDTADNPISNLELVRGDSYFFTGRSDFRLTSSSEFTDPVFFTFETQSAFVRYDIPFDAPDTLYNGTEEIKVVNKTIVLHKDIGPITDDSLLYNVTIPENVTLSTDNYLKLQSKKDNLIIIGQHIKNVDLIKNSINDSTEIFLVDSTTTEEYLLNHIKGKTYKSVAYFAHYQAPETHSITPDVTYNLASDKDALVNFWNKFDTQTVDYLGCSTLKNEV